MVTEPERVSDLLYFTNRALGDGKIMAWVWKKKCPECGEPMGKPRSGNGKPKMRASYYECPECEYQEQKQEHEESCEIEAKYTCPHCGQEGEATGQYKRKTYKGKKAYVLRCEHCDGKLPLTKKIKGVDI